MRDKICILLLALFIMTSGCAGKKEEEKPVTPAPVKVTSIRTEETTGGGHVTSFSLRNHDIYVYEPEDILRGDIINYGYTAPTILVFGDDKMSAEDAVSFIREKGVDQVAQQSGGYVVFVNPEVSWEKEEYGIYEAVLARTKIDQTGYSHGLLYQGESREYFIFASGGRTIVYAYGNGADYVAQNYLKKTEGVSAMSYLGVNDITMTAAVLQNLSKAPEKMDSGIIVVSVENEESINQEMERQSKSFHRGSGSFSEIYDEYIAGYSRTGDVITESFDAKKAGLITEAVVMEIETSADNHSVRMPTYELGAVIFRKADSGQDKRPLLLCFHGGGDTAMLTSTIAGWDQIALEEDFILCAIEMHMRTTATEVMQVVDRLTELYGIDESRIYATGFSMGGIKTWDLFQEYPERFAALAPMGATVAVGKNTQFFDTPSLNEDVPVPTFVCGGENSHLEELPFQGFTCVNRINYLLQVNDVKTSFEMTVINRSEWEDSIYGYEGDEVETLTDESYPGSVTTIRYYASEDGNVYTALCSISNHQHEIRPFTCRQAWDFMKQFSRDPDGSIVISNND